MEQKLTLAELRKRAGLTQRELSIALDITTTTVSAWESGRHVPRLTPIQTFQVLEILGCTLEELVEATQD